jgi:SAM-dependent methyltransferase
VSADRTGIDPAVLERERAHHDQLYSGHAQQHFASPAVLAFRRDFVERLIRRARITRETRLLSLGCGIGDVERLLAPHAKEIVGIDLSKPGIRQARQDAAAITNLRFELGSYDEPAFAASLGQFDVVLAKFFLHHLPPAELARAPQRIANWLVLGGRFYSLDPSRYRLLGWIGEKLIPKKMEQYQTEDESPVSAAELRSLFEPQFTVETRMYDYVSTPLAGLFPKWKVGYRIARIADDALIRVPLLNQTASSLELLATRR